MRIRSFLGPCMVAILATDLMAQSPARIADLRQCTLASGARVASCRIGYRTFGQKNAQGTNVVLIPTWLGGKSSDWVDLGITHLRAVIGVSMGGIQVFEWAATHPDYVDRFVSIVGSPEVARHDRAWLVTLVRMIDAAKTYQIPQDSVWRMFAGVLVLLDVQETVNARPASEADSLLAATALAWSKSINLADYAVQARAILAYGFGKPQKPNSDSVLAGLKGRFLVVNSPDDRVISAGPPLTLARRIGLDTLVLRSSCGHGVFACE